MSPQPQLPAQWLGAVTACVCIGVALLVVWLRRLTDAFAHTGSLRPQKITARRAVHDTIELPDYAMTGVPLSELADAAARQRRGGRSRIEVKTAEDIRKMRLVCKLGREVLDTAAAAVGVGVTTDEIDKVLLRFSL